MKTIINIKADKEVKKGAKKVAEELGLPLSTIINSFLKQLIRERKITFSAEPKLKPRVWERIKKAGDDYKKGKNIAGPFDNTKDLMKHLNS